MFCHQLGFKRKSECAGAQTQNVEKKIWARTKGSFHFWVRSIIRVQTLARGSVVFVSNTAELRAPKDITKGHNLRNETARQTQGEILFRPHDNVQKRSGRVLPSIHEPRANTNIPASRPQARGIILRGLSWSVPHPSTRTGTGTFRSMLLAYRGRRIWSPERDKSPTPSRLVPWPISCPRDGPEIESFYLSTIT